MLSFGATLREARKAKGYSLRNLAELAKVDFTYLSKLENDNASHPPSEKVVRWLAEFFELEADRLIYLSGRIPKDKLDLLCALANQHPDEVSDLFERIKCDPTLVIKGREKKVNEIAEIYKGHKTIWVQASDQDAFFLAFGFLTYYGFSVQKGTGALCLEIREIDYEDDENLVTWNDLVDWLLTRGFCFL